MRVPGIAGRRYLGDDAASARTFDGDWVRTGDIGYLDEDGYLYLVDREADVLNPGGRKVAPSEVEAVLAAHPAVVECAVFGLRHPVLDQLVAAAVVTGAPVTAAELKRFARERLSDYKVPAAIGFVAALPRNEIGKVRRSQLEDLLREPGTASPRPGGTERRLAGIWRSLLGLGEEPDGPSNFFAAGGHSLVVTELAREIEEVFGVTPTMTGLFDHSTLAEQAAYLDALAAAQGHGEPGPGGPRLERLANDVTAPWSYLQEYMWAAKERCPNPGWNVLLSIRLRGPLDVPAVRNALTFLIGRHEVLRTRLDRGQRVDPGAAAELPVTDLTEAGGDGLAGICRAQHRICVDLRHGPAVLPRLVRVAADDHVLLLTMDHASCDGWSAGILLREFAAAYDALADGGEPSLPPVPVRYRDFAAYQRRLVAAGAFDADLGYWRRQLAGLPGGPLLPRRPGAPASPGYRSGLRALDIGPDLAEAVRDLARSADGTVFVILLGALMAAIAAVSGQPDVVVATLSAARPPGTEGVVGMFANPLLLRADVGSAAKHRQLFGPELFGPDLFGRVRAVTAAAHDHGAVPFPVVAERIGPGRPEAWFNMAPPMAFPRARNVRMEPSGIPRNYVIEVPAAGWRGENLLVNGIDTGTSMNLEFDYNTEVVDAATIERLCAAYLDVLRAAVT